MFPGVHGIAQDAFSFLAVAAAQSFEIPVEYIFTQQYRHIFTSLLQHLIGFYRIAQAQDVFCFLAVSFPH